MYFQVRRFFATFSTKITFVFGIFFMNDEKSNMSKIYDTKLALYLLLNKSIWWLFTKCCSKVGFVNSFSHITHLNFFPKWKLVHVLSNRFSFQISCYIRYIQLCFANDFQDFRNWTFFNLRQPRPFVSFKIIKTHTCDFCNRTFKIFSKCTQRGIVQVRRK